ncbi:MAG: AAA family ATPase, partial [Bacteroidota bacterium]
SRKDEIKKFLKKKLKIDFIDSITFKLKKPWWGKGEATDLWGAVGFVKDFFILFSRFCIAPVKSLSESGNEVLYYTSFSPYDLLDLSSHLEGSQPIENFKSTEKILFEILDIILFSDLFDNIDVSINSNGNSFPYSKLSEGEKQLLLTYGLKELINIENSVLLFDEPDTYLHPKWQKEYISNISENIEFSTLIIATHSPNLVSDVHKENLFIMQEGKLKTIPFESYGKPIDDVLIDFFGLDGVRNLKVEGLINKIRNMIVSNQFEKDDFKKEFEVLKEVLGNADKEIMAMTLEIAKRKKANEKNK